MELVQNGWRVNQLGLCSLPWARHFDVIYTTPFHCFRIYLQIHFLLTRKVTATHWHLRPPSRQSLSAMHWLTKFSKTEQCKAALLIRFSGGRRGQWAQLYCRLNAHLTKGRSVRLSVCLSHSWITSKRFKISTYFTSHDKGMCRSRVRREQVC